MRRGRLQVLIDGEWFEAAPVAWTRFARATGELIEVVPYGGTLDVMGGNAGRPARSRDMTEQKTMLMSAVFQA